MQRQLYEKEKYEEIRRDKCIHYLALHCKGRRGILLKKISARSARAGSYGQHYKEFRQVDFFT